MKYGSNSQVKALETSLEILKVLLLFDKAFPRTLSARIGNLTAYADKLAGKAVFKVFLIDNDIIGFIAYYCNDFKSKKAFLSQIAVAETKKKTGIGTLLLNDCLLNCVQMGMQTIECEVDDTNQIAIDFYKKEGFLYSCPAGELSQYLIKKL